MSQPVARRTPPDPRVAELIARMTPEEKVAQLVGLWLGMEAGTGDVVAPLQNAMHSDVGSFEEFCADGLGQLTRPFGTAPVDPTAGAAELARHQQWLRKQTRLGIPALVHEECLTGLAAWRATTYPAPPAWGATFDPELIKLVGTGIGTDLRSLGVHQGLAPVLDVIRDARWGRVEECIAEDPYLVGTVGTAYITGLQDGGVIATCKHFVGYSNSRGGRNLAPVHAGPREVADVLLPPFEMAVLDGGAGSVMNSYAEIDGVPVAADPDLLDRLLRGDWGFDGTVVADYFSVAFLQTLHGVADDLADAARQAITAGIDIELPTGNAYREPLLTALRDGRVDEEIIDRSVARILDQKARLGLLDEEPPLDPAAEIDLDRPESRELARRVAEQSVILLSNESALPLSGTGRIAVIGPNADDQQALFGCYSFANHVLPQHPGVELGLTAPTIKESLITEFGADRIGFAAGLPEVDSLDEAGFAEAVRLAAESDQAVVVVGDRAGLFGRGTSGEGCDTDSLELPGVQRRLVEAILDTGTPTVLVLITGRPYAIEWAVPSSPEARGAAAIVQAFFPGQEGGSAIAGVLGGRINPSGRLPMSMIGGAGAQPYSYLHPRLGGVTTVSNLDPTPTFSFGHGLSYTSFGYGELAVDHDQVPTAGAITARVTVRNTGDRAGAEVVQLYGSDPVASITRPVTQLIGYARVELDPGESREISFDVPTRLLSFSDRTMTKIVEPGRIDLSVRRSVAEVITEATVELTGDVHRVGLDDPRRTMITIADGDAGDRARHNAP